MTRTPIQDLWRDLARSLALRITIPLVLLWVAVGVGLYVHLTGAADQFLDDLARERLPGASCEALDLLDQVRSGLLERFTRAWLGAGLILTLATALAVAAMHRAVRAPIASLVARIRAGERPDYHGLAEIEFLSDSMARMMESLEALNRGLEDLVRKRTRDLARKADELEQANLRLREMDRLKSSFLSAASHELRTPLTSIRGFAKVVARTFERYFADLAKDPETRRRAETIRDNLAVLGAEGERLTRLVDDLLDLTSMEAGQMAWQDQDFDPLPALEEAARAAVGLGRGRPGQAPELEAAGPVPGLRMDRARFVQVMTRLMSNALAVSGQGRVEVAAGTGPGGGVLVRVRSTGPGIPEADLEHVFDAFFQVGVQDAESLTGRTMGTGLGLALARRIVHHYGGRIRAESGPGPGSTFIVELPLAEGA